MMLDENEDSGGIFVPNASTHYFADVIDKMKLGRKVYIIGYNLIKENIKRLKEGLIDFIINQQPLRQGYESVLTMYRRVVLKQDVPKAKMLPIEIVTTENLDSYIEDYSRSL